MTQAHSTPSRLAPAATTPPSSTSARGALKEGLRGQSYEAQVQCLQPIQRKANVVQQKASNTSKVVQMEPDQLAANATAEQIDSYIDNLPGWLYKGKRGETFWRNLVRRLAMARNDADGDSQSSPVAVDEEVVQHEHFRVFVIDGTTVFRQTFASDVSGAFRQLVRINTQQGRMDWQLIANALLMVPHAVGQMQTPIRPGAFGTQPPEPHAPLPNTPGTREAMPPPAPVGGGRPGNGTMGTGTNTSTTPAAPLAPTLAPGGSRAPTMVAPTMPGPTMPAPGLSRAPTMPAPGVSRAPTMVAPTMPAPAPRR